MFEALADLAADGVELITMEGNTIRGTTCGRLMSRSSSSHFNVRSMKSASHLFKEYLRELKNKFLG